MPDDPLQFLHDHNNGSHPGKEREEMGVSGQPLDGDKDMLCFPAGSCSSRKGKRPDQPVYTASQAG